MTERPEDPGSEASGAPPPPGAPPGGAPPSSPPPAWAPPAPRNDNVLGIVGLCCSIAGAALLVVTLGFFWFISLPLSIAGLVCGLLGRQKADRGEVSGGRGVAQAGFIVGIVAIVMHLLALLVFVVIIGLIIEAANEVEIEDPQRRRGLDRSSLSALAATAPFLILPRGWRAIRRGPQAVRRRPRK